MARIEKIEKYLFYALIFFLPFQARIIFKSWGGEFNEWNSAAFYLTDALLLAVIFLWGVRSSFNPPTLPVGLPAGEVGRQAPLLKGGEEGLILKLRRLIIRIGKVEIALFIFLGISALSLANAQNFWLGVFREIKLIEMGVLFLYVKNGLRLYSSSDPDAQERLGSQEGMFSTGSNSNYNSIFQIFVASGLLQALIAIGQFIRQKSFGLSFLDESPLGAGISGVAKIAVEGEKIVRPYGLTPHPNVLAAILAIAIFCALFLFIKKNKDFKWGAAVLYTFAIAILTFSFFITFSRAIIVIGLLTIFAWLIYQYFRSGRKWYFLNTIAIFGVCCLLTAILLWPYLSARFDVDAGLADQALNLRVFYNQVALNFIAQNPALGVGLGNFVWTFQNSQQLSELWMYQPAHNIYLLIAAEIGLLGLIAFLVFLFLIVKSTRKLVLGSERSHLLFVIYFLLLVSLFDHFLWDLQQGQLMLWIMLGLMAGIGAHSSMDRAQASGA